MRNVRLAAILAALLLAASLAAVAARSGAAARAATLGQAAQRTVAAGSLRYRMIAEIRQASGPPYLLQAIGATSPAAAYLHVKVADLYTPNGTVLTGPFAEEETDGSFLYFRSTVTQRTVGNMWVRERTGAVSQTAPEALLLHQLAPSTILRALGRAQAVRTGAGGTVLHASLPYTDPVVQAALSGVEGNVQYQDLRLTAWLGPQGYVRQLALAGRTSDGSSTFLLRLALDGYGRPVSVTPPPQGAFVDFTLSRLTL